MGVCFVNMIRQIHIRPDRAFRFPKESKKHPDNESNERSARRVLLVVKVRLQAGHAGEEGERHAKVSQNSSEKRAVMGIKPKIMLFMIN